MSCLYLTGLEGDGNGNSRSEPPQGTELNGRSPSPSVRNQAQRTAQSSKLCLSSINVLHTTHPFPVLSGLQPRHTEGPGKHPLPPCSPCSVGRMHRGGTAEPLHIHLQGFSCSVRLQVHGALTFHSQLMAGEIQCPQMLRLQPELPETSPALTQLKVGSGGCKEPFQPSLHHSFLHLPPQRLSTRQVGLLTRNDVAASSQCSTANSQPSALK